MTLTVRFPIPSAVTETPTRAAISELYVHARSLPANPADVVVWRQRNRKGTTALETAIRSKLQSCGLYNSSNLYRGLSKQAVEACLQVFVPVYSTSACAEFGIGISTSRKLKDTMLYAGSNGAIMVFGNVDMRGGNLKVWTPNETDWVSLVTTNMKCGKVEVLPEAYVPSGGCHRWEGDSEQSGTGKTAAEKAEAITRRPTRVC